MAVFSPFKPVRPGWTIAQKEFFRAWSVNLSDLLVIVVAMSAVKPLKLGVRFDPAAIVLVYSEEATKKLHRRIIPIRNMDVLTDIDTYTKTFLTNDKYKRYFGRIKEKKLEKFFFILQDHMKGYTTKESLQRLNANECVDDYEQDDEIEDLTKDKIQTYEDDEDDEDYSF